MPCLGSTRPTDGIGPYHAVRRSRREDAAPRNGDSNHPSVDISLVSRNWWGELEHVGRGRRLVRLLVGHTGCTVCFCHVRFPLFPLPLLPLTHYHSSLCTGRFIVDTWQYFLHRAMHLNKFLYRQFHSWHHRLYVPYAFGALYNHPLEGFLLDSLGALIAHLATGMTARQATLFYSFSTFKTVDDHCGYSLPFDPLQLMTSNNADYHDIHHQVRSLLE